MGNADILFEFLYYCKDEAEIKSQYLKKIRKESKNDYSSISQSNWGYF